MTKNKEKLVKVEAVCTSMTGEFRDTNEDNFYFNGQYMDSDGGLALRLTSGEPEEVEPEEEELSEESKKRMEWIEENAYRYGFVIRYQQEQEKKTGHWYQPFMLRYVGVKTAKLMHDSGKGMEQMSFPDELE